MTAKDGYGHFMKKYILDQSVTSFWYRGKKGKKIKTGQQIGLNS